jgi:hypothetical protein
MAQLARQCGDAAHESAGDAKNMEFAHGPIVAGLPAATKPILHL